MGSQYRRLRRQLLAFDTPDVNAPASVLLVTHSPEHAAWADRICFLKEGVIAGSVTQSGGPENLAPIYAELQRLGI